MATIPTDLLSDLKQDIPPSGSWVIEATLPQLQPAEDHIYSLVVREPGEIWILKYEKLFRYLTSTNSWKEYSAIGDLIASPKSLYVSRLGTLWGIDLSQYGELDNAQEMPFLIRFDEETESFHFVRDRDNLLNSNMDLVGISEPNENNQEIWMLTVENKDQTIKYSLISFNVETLQATVHFKKQVSWFNNTSPISSLTDMAITPDGRVWIMDRGQEQLLYYDPSSGSSGIYQGNPGAIDGLSGEDLRDSHYLYVDRLGQLWIDDRGWLDFSNPNNPVWHKIISSPVFISDSVAAENQYGWIRPYLMHQSLDGLYWFSSSNVGMVNLDPATGKWCNFTTGSSPIAEDDHGNLWIAVFGKLYRNNLKK